MNFVFKKRKFTARVALAVSCALFFLGTSPAVALTNLGERLIDQFRGGGLAGARDAKKFYQTSFGKKQESDQGATSFGLYGMGVITSKQAVLMRLREGVISSKFDVIMSQERRHPGTGRVTQEFLFYLNGFPLCDYFLKAHTSGAGRAPMISGMVPDFDPRSFTGTGSNFPDAESLRLVVAENLQVDPDRILVSAQSKCLKFSRGVLEPASKVRFSIGRSPYSAVLGKHQIYSAQQEFFNVAGTVNAYEKNPLDGTTRIFPMDFTGSTHLETVELTTTTGSIIPRATDSGHKFEYTISDEEFAEANAFSHTHRMYQWFKGLGYVWGSMQLTVATREAIRSGSGSSQNNALYLPRGFDGKNNPVIAVGDGEGGILQNLPFDSDVVGHEFAHHVLFQNLTSTQQSEEEDGSIENPNHSASLHEGLADFFTFSYSGDACLGESICPDNTPACQVMSSTRKCLRTGELDLKYGSSEYWQLGKAVHLKGQVVSATMWDIRNRPGVDPDDFTKIAFGMVDYLLASSTYSDWLIALMSADQELFDGKYGCDIAAAAEARGFTQQVQEHISDCAKFKAAEKNAVDPTPPGSLSKGETITPSNSGSEAGTPNGTRKKTKKKFCGSIALAAGHPSYGLMVLVVLMVLPMFLLFTRPSPIRVRGDLRRR